MERALIPPAQRFLLLGKARPLRLVSRSPSRLHRSFRRQTPPTHTYTPYHHLACGTRPPLEAAHHLASQLFLTLLPPTLTETRSYLCRRRRCHSFALAPRSTSPSLAAQVNYHSLSRVRYLCIISVAPALISDACPADSLVSSSFCQPPHHCRLTSFRHHSTPPSHPLTKRQWTNTDRMALPALAVVASTLHTDVVLLSSLP